MLGLTLHRPWAAAVAAGVKRVENRPWRPPAELIGQRFAIHAGKVWDAEAASLVERLEPGLVARLEHPAGAIVAVATLAGVTIDVAWLRDDPVWAEQERWFSGPFGWLLEDVVEIPPVPCPGRQRLWRLPPAVQARVRRLETAARSRR